MDIRQCFSEGTFKWDLKTKNGMYVHVHASMLQRREMSQDVGTSGKDHEAERTLRVFEELGNDRTSIAGLGCSSHKVRV